MVRNEVGWTLPENAGQRSLDAFYSWCKNCQDSPVTKTRRSRLIIVIVHVMSARSIVYGNYLGCGKISLKPVHRFQKLVQFVYRYLSFSIELPCLVMYVVIVFFKKILPESISFCPFGTSMQPSKFCGFLTYRMLVSWDLSCPFEMPNIVSTNWFGAMHLKMKGQDILPFFRNDNLSFAREFQKKILASHNLWQLIICKRTPSLSVHHA